MTGAELREARKTAGLSMKQAAEESGTPYRTWQDWEGGKRRVPGLAFAWLKQYQAVLKIANWELWGDVNSHESAYAMRLLCKETIGQVETS